MKERTETLSNLQRVLTSLEKAVDRLYRQNFLRPSQRPPIFDQIASAIARLRQWIADYRKFAGLKSFYILTSAYPEKAIPRPGTGES